MKHLALPVAIAIAATACDTEPATAPTSVSATSTGPRKTNNAAPQPMRRVAISVTSTGYEPSSVGAEVGVPMILVFKRIAAEGCGDEVVFPDRDIKRSLPLNEEVEIEVTPTASETITFSCGMGMYHGKVVASES